MQILFLGDSITDAGRDRSDCREMGSGYPKYAKAALETVFPEAEFLNWGISGYRSGDVLGQWEAQKDSVSPDVVTLMIGINDVWRKYDSGIATPPEVFEANVRALLESVTGEKHARVVLIEPYYLERGRLSLPFVPAGQDPDRCMRGDTDELIRVTRKLAREYARALMPADGLMHEWLFTTDPESLTRDGVHPGPAGAELLGRYLARQIEAIVRSDG